MWMVGCRVLLFTVVVVVVVVVFVVVVVVVVVACSFDVCCFCGCFFGHRPF